MFSPGCPVSSPLMSCLCPLPGVINLNHNCCFQHNHLFLMMERLSIIHTTYPTSYSPLASVSGFSNTNSEPKRTIKIIMLNVSMNCREMQYFTLCPYLELQSEIQYELYGFHLKEQNCITGLFLPSGC